MRVNVKVSVKDGLHRLNPEPEKAHNLRMSPLSRIATLSDGDQIPVCSLGAVHLDRIMENGFVLCGYGPDKIYTEWRCTLIK
jgi:hypothetical protein